MASVYVALAIFAVIALLEPLLMLLGSKLIRRRSKGNRVKEDNYESAERSQGKRTSLMGEYLHYFPMFLAYEVLVVIMLIWVVSAGSLSALLDYAILGLFVLGFIFELFVIAIVRRAGE